MIALSVILLLLGAAICATLSLVFYLSWTQASAAWDVEIDLDGDIM